MATGLVGCSRRAPEPDAASTNPALVAARETYRKQCALCHGTSGRGAPHVFPPLRGPSWVNARPPVPVRIVLQGLEGPIEVGGESYLNKMLPLGQALDDSTIAAVLTYVRASWGNASGPVSAAEVSRIREATRGRDRAWTVEELQPFFEAPSP